MLNGEKTEVVPTHPDLPHMFAEHTQNSNTQHQQISLTGQSLANCTTILPVLTPVNRPINASGAFSIPEMMVVRY